jgi:glycosidase
MTDWADHAIWWQVYPLGFLGAEASALPPDAPPVPRLRALEPWLDYLIELGCNGFALGPIFASETHGYDTTDYYRIDPRLGTEDDLRWLIDTCHERGIRVLLDGVFNHVGRSFGPFRDVISNGQSSPYKDWFRIDWNAQGPDGFGYANFEGHSHLVALNHHTPAVVDYVSGVMNRWLDFGVDGWRLDAAYAVPLAFWRQVSDRVHAAHPEAWLVGEVIHGDYAAFVRDGGLDSTTQYELWKAIRSSLNDCNFFELWWTLARNNDLARTFAPMTFAGNHDVTRLASAIRDERYLPHALVALFTVAGIPSIYYGDEQGFRGIKEAREHGDDAIRQAFPGGPGDLASFGWPTFRLHQELICVRRRHPWLVRAQTNRLHLATEQLAYESRGPGGESLIVLLNLADIPFAFEPRGAVREVLARSAPADSLVLPIEPHGWAILACD